MSMFGGLGGLLENAIAGHPSGVSGVFGEALQGMGGFDGVIAQLNQAGLGAKVNSWLGKGPNVPLTEDEVRSALNDQNLKMIGDKLGIPMDQVAAVLAQHLPNAVNQVSPNGTIVPPKPMGEVAGGVAGAAAAGGIAGVAGSIGGSGKTST